MTGSYLATASATSLITERSFQSARWLLLSTIGDVDGKRNVTGALGLYSCGQN